MKKSIFISDLHASLHLPFAKVSGDGTTSDRLKDVLAVLDHVRRVADNEGVEDIFILGDLFDQRHPDSPTLNLVARALQSLIVRNEGKGSVVDRDVWLLPGNHDAHDRQGKVYSLGMFEELNVEGLHVATKPRGFSAGGVHFTLVPWLPEPLFNDCVSGLTTGPEPKVLLIHQTLPGATEGSYVAKKGVDPGKFGPWKMILSGHIHTPQSFEPRGRYLGSPLHLRFTDADDREPRGFWLFDHDHFTQLCDYDDDPTEALTLIETSLAPRFVRWRFIADEEYTCSEIAEDLLDELVGELEELDVPVYLEVLVEGDRDDVVTASAIVQGVVDEWGERTKNLRHSRMSRVILDDGVTDRVRAATSSGKLATPGELADAFVDASELLLPDGITADELKSFAAEVMP